MINRPGKPSEYGVPVSTDRHKIRALSRTALLRLRISTYRRDKPNATVRFLDTGHFALETHVEEIAFAIRQLLVKSAA
jgi:hypothetical protein